jgi:hypothetical protein
VYCNVKQYNCYLPQAGPWYLYWPYAAHFQAAAPGVNPYFTAMALPPGFGQPPQLYANSAAAYPASQPPYQAPMPAPVPGYQQQQRPPQGYYAPPQAPAQGYYPPSPVAPQSPAVSAYYPR